MYTALDLNMYVSLQMKSRYRFIQLQQATFVDISWPWFQNQQFFLIDWGIGFSLTCEPTKEGNQSILSLLTCTSIYNVTFSLVCFSWFHIIRWGKSVRLDNRFWRPVGCTATILSVWFLIWRLPVFVPWPTLLTCKRKKFGWFLALRPSQHY